MKLFPILFFASFFLKSEPTPVDMLVLNAKIYTVDSAFTIVEAMAIDKGKIVETGSSSHISTKYSSKNIVDAKGAFIYPGFIDAHAHFYGYALGLNTVNLTETNSWEAVLARLKKFANENKPKGWILGRGWDQNDWAVKEFPTKEKLDQLFPNQPVLLIRIDGHAAIANQNALDLAGVRAGDTLRGGIIETKNGKLTGVLIDNAVDLVSSSIPAPAPAEIVSLLKKAQQNCFEVGLTTVDDCGIDYTHALFMDSLQKADILKMRIYAMLSDAKRNYDFLFANGKIKTDRMHVRSFKIYGDGALGSRGACLLSPYHDQKEWHGFLLNTLQHFDSVASVLANSEFQMCTHAIGDSANRSILNIYAKYLNDKNDRRWRIEHAQVVHPSDFASFGQYNIIPSVQPTHATSDMYWAGERLGSERENHAYAYKKLMEQNGWIPLGTDFPVEHISPFKTFYAAVFRIDAKGFPQGGYQKENALNVEDVLRGMTIWAARANFEEDEKGSLEKGKLADFVILPKDLLKCSPQEILSMKVLATYVGGEKVYERKLK